MGGSGLLLILVLQRAKIKKTYLFWEILKKYRFWYIPGNYPTTVLWIRTVSMRIGTQLFSSLRIQFQVRILVGFCRRTNFYLKNILYVDNNIGNIKNPFERSKFRLICFLFSFLAPGSESHIPHTDPYPYAKSMQIRIHNTVHQWKRKENFWIAYMEGVLCIAFWLDGTTQAYGAPGAYGQKPFFWSAGGGGHHRHWSTGGGGHHRHWSAGGGGHHGPHLHDKQCCGSALFWCWSRSGFPCWCLDQDRYWHQNDANPHAGPGLKFYTYWKIRKIF